MAGPQEGQLLPESLGLVIEELFEIRLKWYNIGLMLGIAYSALDNIKHAFQEHDCFREMLIAWFKRDQKCTWQALVSALRTSAVGEYSLANKLEKKFLHVDDDYSETLSSPWSQTSSGSDVSVSSQDHKVAPAFGCGCGRCNINSFLDGRCPNPEKSLSSFPYLNTSAMKATDVFILKGRLYEDFCRITREFSKFRTAICESLIDRNVPVQKLVRVLRDLRAFSHVHTDTPLLGRCWQEISAAETVDDIFNITTDYVSFFNFQITEHIVENLGTDLDKILLSEYTKKRDEYCKRNIFECPSYSTLCVEEAILVMKVEGIEEYSMKHLAGLVSLISRALSVANHSLKLCTVDKGCVKLIFQAPVVVQDIFPLTCDKLGKLMDISVHITLLKCGRWLYQFPVDPKMETDHPSQQKGIYNHGLLSRQVAELKLKSTDYDCFLIRESERHRNNLVYSLKKNKTFTHILLEEKTGGLYGLKGESEAYPSLDFFITNVARGFCLMPIPLKEIQVEMLLRALKIESDQEESDHGVHDLYDGTGDETDEARGSGDSAIVLGCRLPYLTMPSPLVACDNSSDTYKKLNLKTMDVASSYASLTDASTKKNAEQP